MGTSYSVSFIGSGNVAWHLAPELDNAGFVVQEVYSRNKNNAQALTKRLYQANAKNNLDFSESKSNVFVISVSDEAIAEVAREMILPEDAILVHTSGSQPLSILEYAATDKTGVFYPLQTFSKGSKVSFKEIPMLLETKDKQVEKVLHHLATAISNHVRTVSSADRKALHVAAVFACNFSNHMFSIAKNILDNNQLDFTLLKPLIVETINKSLRIGPENGQTGPAKRQDMETLDKHMEYLAESEAWSEIYKVITQNILDTYHS